ncbi:SNF2 domain-containing protein CLASSY 3-like [Andrographis paniculata]|uniref:SNF2 domain-containing protein CLASSY 3-like n=1 Tax=Andrographis paniculata TaxID=175694 RepID=UPI0021E7693B|nr:SNF2 domain-containing protein CLASSY 3-like [Andrographis paniculata]XP_051141163.1 SNF2 domain-containing protein CLASSY 3-like [Andrographis paniculata]
MHVAEPRMDSVSRRTRSQWDTFYKKRYYEIRKDSDEKKNHDNGSGEHMVPDDCEQGQLLVSGNDGNVGKVARKNEHGIIHVHDSEGSSTADDSTDAVEQSADDYDKDYKVYSLSNVKEKGRKHVGRPSKNKACLIGGSNRFNKLLDDILKGKGSVGRKLKKKDVEIVKPAPTKESDQSYSALPMKFRFEDHQPSITEPSITEKSDMENNLDSLYDELEIELCGFETPSANCPLTDDEWTTSTDIDESQTDHCSRGKHYRIFDEQIGIVCKYCRETLLEIKYVLPELNSKTHEWSGRRGVKELDYSILRDSSTCCKLESSLHSEGTILDLIPDAESDLYPHQLEGFEFLWRNIAGEIKINKLEKLSPDGGRGCIISHAPGTGKTRLTIVFLQTFLKLYPSSRPVIIAPRGILLTWENEFRKWNVNFKFHNLNNIKLSGEETAIATGDSRVNRNNKNYVRIMKLNSWMEGGSILGIGYRLFEELASDHQRKWSNNKFKNILLELPDVLVLDEGHTPRNHQSLTWKVLTNVTTQRRIILSGTPFQNNFSELYNTLCLVNPQFSQQIMPTDCIRKSRKQSGRKRKANAARDEWAYLTNSIADDPASEVRLKELRSMMEPFVHVHKGCILQKALPGLRDYLIILKPTSLQTRLLQNLDRFDNFIEQTHLSSLILVHPALVAEKPEFSEHRRKLKLLETNSSAGVKTLFLINLIKLSVGLHEKVLVFSEFIDPLHHIQKLLAHHFSYKEGQEVIYMDGDLNMKHRQRLINLFNDKKSEAKVLLASLKACSEGINLVGASRVVLLDVVWNPSVERQAICRAYRLGQEKVVHVYHLITTPEMRKYARQAQKDRLSDLIFCPAEGNSKMSGSLPPPPCPNGGNAVVAAAVSEDQVLEAIVEQQSLANMVDRIVLHPKESDLVSTFGFVDLH